MARETTLESAPLGPIAIAIILCLALAVRVAVAVSTDSRVHPDEIMQYFEQAHRLTYGYGLVPWEYIYGIRSWLIPGSLSLCLDALRLVGVEQPDATLPALKILLCIFSLWLPWSMYRIGRSLFSEAVGRVALVIGSFWYELVYFAAKPMPDCLAATTLFLALALLFGAPGRTPGRMGRIGFGALLALTVALRFQLAPVVGIAGLIALGRWRLGAAWAAIAFVVVLAADGWLDAYSWGIWFSSIVNNFRYNFSYDLSGHFGANPLFYYFAALLITSAGLVLVGALGLLADWRRGWPLIAMGAVGFASFSLIGHKEARFVFFTIPIVLIGLSVAVARSPRMVRGALLLGVGLVSVAGMSSALPFQARIYHARLIETDDLMQAYLALSREHDVEGVIDGSDRNWWQTGGYTMLHHDTPIYRADLVSGQMTDILGAPQSYASHWILPTGTAIPDGYELLSRQSRFIIARRTHRPEVVRVAPGFSMKIPDPFHLPVTVVPRW